ncbi:hypothetical protein AYI68_g1970 [Smittium mucronatum]|uniref:CoA-binding domain-containing protein n=1 Tax=Smittium mucronatum TaxID=133383 RepID=A0A1R0H411_9FUNG|nr:hypothetical protein AYI68_g1970 [Smittium mucronatum]
MSNPSQVAFLSRKVFGVAGASVDVSKYGNRVLKFYKSHNRNVIPINPKEKTIEDLEVVKTVPELVEMANVKYHVEPSQIALSIVTPPRVSEQILHDAAKAGIKQVWMQPGSEPANWQELSLTLGLDSVGGGPCVLMT